MTIEGAREELRILSQRPPEVMTRDDLVFLAVGIREVLLEEDGQVLVVSEIAVVMVVITGAGAMVHDLQRRSTLDLGYEPRELLTMNVTLARAAGAAVTGYQTRRF